MREKQELYGKSIEIVDIDLDEVFAEILEVSDCDN